MDNTNPLADRIQIGIKMEKRMVKVLKAVAEYHDITLGEMIESLVLHAFDNKIPFDAATSQRVEQLKRVYSMDYTVSIAHHFTNETTTQPKLM